MDLVKSDLVLIKLKYFGYCCSFTVGFNLCDSERELCKHSWSPTWFETNLVNQIEVLCPINESVAQRFLRQLHQHLDILATISQILRNNCCFLMFLLKVLEKHQTLFPIRLSSGAANS
jgi:hypothetical protein